jgi:hypothetical protein
MTEGTGSAPIHDTRRRAARERSPTPRRQTAAPATISPPPRTGLPQGREATDFARTHSVVCGRVHIADGAAACCYGYNCLSGAVPFVAAGGGGRSAGATERCGRDYVNAAELCLKHGGYALTWLFRNRYGRNAIAVWVQGGCPRP